MRTRRRHCSHAQRPLKNRQSGGGCASGVVVVKLFTAHVIRHRGGGREVADVGVGSPAALVEEEGEYVEIGEKM